MSIQSAILFTLAYADIFDYPLTKEELIVWLPYGDRYDPSKITREIKKLLHRKKIETYKTYLTLPGRTSTVSVRLGREKETKRKMRIARHISRILFSLPTILLIGVTGGLSIGNADKEDDIDFFIITRTGTLWITRLLATWYLDILGKRRKPRSQSIADRICLNMYVSERAVGMEKQDIFTGHEILQMTPVINVDHTYEKFLSANVWTSYLFPHRWRDIWGRRASVVRITRDTPNRILMSRLLKLTEKPVMVAQLWYMRARRTKEVLGGDVIRFHPHDARIWVRDKLRKRLKTIHIKPLDK